MTDIRATAALHVRYSSVNRCQRCETPWPCLDRIAYDDLLAEVDRLTALPESQPTVALAVQLAKRHERARIRAAVEGLPGTHCACCDMVGVFECVDEDVVDRAAALAAVEGADHA
jgi:hypothetical protein